MEILETREIRVMRRSWCLCMGSRYPLHNVLRGINAQSD